jgi:hypothetical protein
MMINNNNKRFFTTDDMVLATALICHEYTFVTCIYEGDSYKYRFITSEGLDEAIQKFRSNKLFVKPQEYTDIFWALHDNYHIGGRYDD